jgi:hypothetical protein
VRSETSLEILIQLIIGLVEGTILKEIQHLMGTHISLFHHPAEYFALQPESVRTTLQR